MVPMPLVGSQPSWTPKSRIASSPNQKTGIDRPMNATAVAT
jgi:hypothetical protein